MCVLSAQGQNRVLDSQELVTDGCKIPDEGWEPNPGPVQEQQALLSAEPSLHPPKLGT